ncbi:hypothetical protein CN428_24480 [Bacillus cereus]|nr:hypothetical protein CN428_24480 [Bacillus cereus]
MTDKLNDTIKKLSGQSNNKDDDPSDNGKDGPSFKSKHILEDKLPDFGMRTEFFTKKRKTKKSDEKD